MADKKYICPPTPATGSGTFADNLVGFQLVQGGGLTQGNFTFTSSVTEKTNRTFNTGTFSDPINLDSMGIESVQKSKEIFENNFKVYPNFDLSQVTNFTLYGSLQKRISVSVQKIINYFPASIESTFLGLNYNTGATATNISYNPITDITVFSLDCSRIRNQFDVDYTVNSTRNLKLREISVSPLRDLTVEYSKYSLFYKDNEYGLAFITPTTSLVNGILNVSVFGNPFSGNTEIFDSLLIRPNDYEVNQVFNEQFDEVEKFLLNRNVNPKYTATFSLPKESDDGTYYTSNENITWPLNGPWNIDIISSSFTSYLTKLNDISESLDSYKTNLISRFLTTGAIKDFDTIDQKVEKSLQIYGRSFDETKKFIDALAYMNSVNYNVGNDIPSQLLKNLAQTLGWKTSMSPITNDDFLASVFGEKKTEKSQFSGISSPSTPDELNYQYFRNIVLNSAYLFKSKGTRKSVEILMRLIGAPDALVEFNEYVYLADQVINLNQFNNKFSQISGGTYLQELPVLDNNDIYTFQGVNYTGFTTTSIIKDVNIGRDEYPMDDNGYPKTPIDSEEYYFQIGSGWFEQTPEHRAPESVNTTNSVFTGSNPDYQTTLVPYTYGQDYLSPFRSFPFMDLGYNLNKVIDNNKSWVDYETGLRSNLDGGYNARYFTEDDRLVLNVKNIDLFLNPSQGLLYDVWYMSREYNFPIPDEGLNYSPATYCNPIPSGFNKMGVTQFTATFPNTPYPQKGGVDWTEINPKPKRQTFFEFAQTFWTNMINVRNRQYATGGYPTLESIYWKYLESENYINQPNDNFTYETMIQYVNGLGDYWVRLVEQMMPASTLFNAGTKFENSIFHRQKFAWRRQRGCQIVPVSCGPCTLSGNLYRVDCPTQSVECSIYPWNENPAIQSFSAILGNVINNYVSSIGNTISNCNLNSITSEWFVDIRLNDVTVISKLFFNGVGLSVPLLSSPSDNDWLNAVIESLDEFKNYGYDYEITENDTILIYNTLCTESDEGVSFKLNVGINFNITCN